MKKLLIAVTLLLGLSAMAHSNPAHKEKTHGHYKNDHSSHNTYKKRKTHYTKATLHRPVHKRTKCYPHHRQQHSKQHVLAYKNIAYWHNRNMARPSGRPLYKIRIDRRYQNHNCVKQH